MGDAGVRDNDTRALRGADDTSPGDVIAAFGNGTVVLDDGVTTISFERACAWLAADRARLLSRLARAKAALADAESSWSFDDGQMHTHSWHDREDWRERNAEALRSARGESGGAE